MKKNKPLCEKYFCILPRKLLVFIGLSGIFLLGSIVSAHAAERDSIRGQVVDKESIPLSGVSVVVKGTNLGTATNADGIFSLVVSEGKEIMLRFSLLGMKPVEVKYTGQKSIDVMLEEDASTLGEVVVTGYFNRDAQSYTGSVKTVKAEQILQVNPTNLLSALSVIEPSFRMIENIQDGSNPNSLPEFEMRGTASLPNATDDYRGSPNMPTFILDGFEVSAEKVFDLDPQRVESVTLLKDAAATAIYGSRAGNGVVVITTNVPKAGKINITYNLDLGGTFPDLRDYNIMDARQKLAAESAAGLYTPVDYLPNDLNPSTIFSRQMSYNAKMKLVVQGNDAYWLDKPLQNALSNKHTLSVEGGEGAMRFRLDGTWDDAPGVMKESGRTRKGLNLMVQYTINSKLVLRDEVTYSDVLSKNSPYGSFKTYALINPYYAPYDDKGNYAYRLETDFATDFGLILNPLHNTQLNMKDESRYNQWVNNFSADWWINDAFRLKANFSIAQRDDEGAVFKPAAHTDFADWAIYSENGYRRGTYKASDGRALSYDGSLVLSYNQRFGEHYLNGNAVVNIQEQSEDGYSLFLEGYPDDRLDYIAFALQYSETDKLTAYDDKSRMIGVVGSVNYTYANRFLADFSFRTDASSKFGADKRWAPFWAAGIGWNLHKEAFLKDVSFLNLLKIRGSYGLTGSQSFNPYQAYVMYKYWTDQRYRWSTGGASMKGIGNKDLEWQQVAKANIGFDAELFKSWVNLSLDYYNEDTKGLLTDVMLPPSLGFSSYRENLGEIRNRGYELSLRAFLIKQKDAYLSLSFAAIHNKNKLQKLSASLLAWNATVDTTKTNQARVRYAEGLSTKTIWGVQSLGINPATGYEIYRTIDGRLTDKWDAKDQVPIGVDEPDLEGNIGINAGWKGFQLTAYGRYRLGGQIYNQSLVTRVENADLLYNADVRVLEDRWKRPGDVTYFKGIAQNTITEATSRFVNDYSYFQFASANLSYDFPKAWIKSLRIQSLRLSVSVNDIFRISTVKEERGIDYPYARSARGSLRIVF